MENTNRGMHGDSLPMLSLLWLSNRKPLPLGVGYITPSGFAVLGRFTDTVKGRVAVKVAGKLKKSAESTLFELDFENFARPCKLNKTPHILTVADKSANKKARPKRSGFNCANFGEFTVQIFQI